MRYLPVHCELHGWLLLDEDAVRVREGKRLVECEAHMVLADMEVPFIETTERPEKIRCLSDEEMQSLKDRAKKGEG